MLSALSVRNIVLIDQLDLALDDGLTVLTGETGAGKSILLDALTLALGGRGDQRWCAPAATAGRWSRSLHLPPDHPARQTLRDNAIADDEDLILRRVQFADGRTRAFINDQPVSAALMRSIGALVVEIHGQHDDRALVDTATHRALLDAFGGLDAEVAAVARAARGASRRREAAVRDAEGACRARLRASEEYARHVVEELAELAPEPGEEEELAERRQQLMQLEKSADEVRDADEMLNGPTAPGPVLAALMRRLSAQGEAGGRVRAAGRGARRDAGGAGPLDGGTGGRSSARWPSIRWSSSGWRSGCSRCGRRRASIR